MFHQKLFIDLVWIRAKFTVALILFTTSVTSISASDLKLTFDLALDGQAGYLPDAYSLQRFSKSPPSGQTGGSGGGSGGGGGAGSNSRAPILNQLPISLTLRFSKEFPLGEMPFNLAISGAAKWGTVKLTYPKGIGVFPDPIYLNSASAGVELRGGPIFSLRALPARVESGLGLHFLMAVDTFNYGRWTLVERRQKTVAFGYMKVSVSLNNAISFFADAQSNHLGPNYAIGLNWKL